MISTSFLSFLSLSLILSSCLAQSIASGSCTYRDHAVEAVRVMQQGYSTDIGLYTPYQWWTSANSIYEIADLIQHVPEVRSEFEGVLSNTFIKGQIFNLSKQNKSIDGVSHTNVQATMEGFNNEFYDDSGWWALAWIKAYDVTYNPEYLKQAKNIFEYIRGAWDDSCGGGVWWKTDKKYKNAITNELFLTIAASLANRDAGTKEYYLSWAKRELEWFRKSGMINSRELINDGLNEQCVNNGQQEWSYNQGVIIGGLCELSLLEKGDYLSQAVNFARASVAKLTENDVLTEPCEHGGTCEGAEEFKGIYVRYLGQLQQIINDDALRSYLFQQANSLFERGNQNGSYTVFWNAMKSTTLNTAAQFSAASLYTQCIRAGGCAANFQQKPESSSAVSSSSVVTSSSPVTSSESVSTSQAQTSQSVQAQNAQLPPGQSPVPRAADLSFQGFQSSSFQLSGSQPMPSQPPNLQTAIPQHPNLQPINPQNDQQHITETQVQHTTVTVTVQPSQIVVEAPATPNALAPLQAINPAPPEQHVTAHTTVAEIRHTTVTVTMTP